MVGYASQTKPLVQGGFNQIDFALEAVEFGIGSVVITPGDNPAHPILRGVIRRKPQNDPDLYDSYTCATYTKMQLDLTNIKPRFRSKRLQRNFGFVFDYIDTSALTGQAYLPAMISEATADYYHSRRNPAVSREIIRASRVSGVEDSFAIAQFTGQMHGNVNFLRQITSTSSTSASPVRSPIRVWPSTTIFWWTACRWRGAKPTKSASIPSGSPRPYSTAKSISTRRRTPCSRPRRACLRASM